MADIKEHGIWLDVGCGRKKKRGWYGLDVRDIPGVDIVHDVEDIPWPLEDNSCSLVMLSHLWEHIKPWKTINVMDELWRITRADGQVHITVPYGTSAGFLQDPTHINPVTEQTWEYFDPQFTLYKVYAPKPWHLIRREHQAFGNMLAAMEPKKDKAQSRVTGAGKIAISRTKDEQLNPSEVVEAFHKVEYDLRHADLSPQWMGVMIDKPPVDLWNYQEVIWEVKPKVIIETGTANGGSALYFAHLLDLLSAQTGHDGIVITVDVDDGEVSEQINCLRTNSGKHPEHSRIKYILGSSVEERTALEVMSHIDGSAPVMVILDSDHTKHHVRLELEIYHPLVSVGSYLVVEDSNVNGHPVYDEFGAGPYEAIEAWIRHHPEFVIDREREERFLYTHNPSGWLKRVEMPKDRKRGKHEARHLS